MTHTPFTLKPAHVRAGLAVVAVCGAVVLATLLVRGAPEFSVADPEAFWLILPGVLGAAGVALPLLGSLGGAAPLHAKRTPLFFLLPALVLAAFLDPQLSGFPVQIFCIVGIVVGLLGTIVTLFDTLETLQARTPARSRLTE